MFETETFGPCLVRKLKWGEGGGGMDPLAPPVATPLLVHSVPPKKKILLKTPRK